MVGSKFGQQFPPLVKVELFGYCSSAFKGVLTSWMPRGKRWESFPKEATFPRRLLMWWKAWLWEFQWEWDLGLVLNLGLAYLGLVLDTGTWYGRELEDPW